MCQCCVLQPKKANNVAAQNSNILTQIFATFYIINMTIIVVIIAKCYADGTVEALTAFNLGFRICGNSVTHSPVHTFFCERMWQGAVLLMGSSFPSSIRSHLPLLSQRERVNLIHPCAVSIIRYTTRPPNQAPGI